MLSELLHQVEWLLHLNDVQLRKYAYAMLRDGSSSASGSTARAFQKELDLMTTIERELESLRRETKEVRTSRRFQSMIADGPLAHSYRRTTAVQLQAAQIRPRSADLRAHLLASLALSAGSPPIRRRT